MSILNRDPYAASSNAVSGQGAVKLGEITAMKIEAQIAARGWTQGEVLGSESELLDEYGVSRAVLREAIRLLEHHGVATMRRGPGGGLIVRHPEPASAVHMLLGLALLAGRRHKRMTLIGK